MITTLKQNEVFVFGSNESGIHGAGAAKQALNSFGAEWGTGYGPTGQCFAIPTKDRNIQTLPLEAIEMYVKSFIEYADKRPALTFLLTPIGTGLAGYKVEDIAPMFKEVPSNVVLPGEFTKYFELCA